MQSAQKKAEPVAMPDQHNVAKCIDSCISKWNGLLVIGSSLLGNSEGSYLEASVMTVC